MNYKFIDFLLVETFMPNAYYGFPEVYDFGKYKSFNWFAMELLGPSSKELFYFCGNKFSLKTTIFIGM